MSLACAACTVLGADEVMSVIPFWEVEEGQSHPPSLQAFPPPSLGRVPEMEPSPSIATDGIATVFGDQITVLHF